MDALVMCGGRGIRLDAAVEKPLYEVGGRPMVDRVLDGLRAGPVETIHAVASPHAPETREHVATHEHVDTVVDAPGEGYVADLGYALERVEPPVLTVAADLPLLAADAVEAVLEAFAGPSLTVCVPAALKRLLGASVDVTTDAGGRTVAPTGVNVVAGTGEPAGEAGKPAGEPAGEAGGGPTDDGTYLTYDVRLAVNVNRTADAEVAEELL